jgi:hypothetical protein
MLLLELLSPSDALKFKPNVAAHRVRVLPTPEEEVIFKQAGIPPEVRDVYVVYAFQEPTKDNLPVQDRLKLRAGNEERIQDVEDMINDAISVAQRTSTKTMNHKWEQSRVAVSQFQNWMRTGKFIVVPMPSSSPTPQLVAAAISKLSGAQIVDAFKKNPYPSLSHHLVRNQRGVAYDFAAEKAKYNALVAQVDAAAERDDVDAWEKLETQRIAAEKALKTYSRKKQMDAPQSLYGRAYYNTIQMSDNPNSSALRDAYVMIVDDNIVTGHSIADAIKQLILSGIRPKDIIGFAPHQFT